MASTYKQLAQSRKVAKQRNMKQGEFLVDTAPTYMHEEKLVFMFSLLDHHVAPHTRKLACMKTE